MRLAYKMAIADWFHAMANNDDLDKEPLATAMGFEAAADYIRERS